MLLMFCVKYLSIITDVVDVLSEKSFDSDINVSVFETNIRIVGGKPIQRLIIFIPATKFDIIFIRIA